MAKIEVLEVRASNRRDPSSALQNGQRRRTYIIIQGSDPNIIIVEKETNQKTSSLIFLTWQIAFLSTIPSTIGVRAELCFVFTVCHIAKTSNENSFIFQNLFLSESSMACSGKFDV